MDVDFGPLKKNKKSQKFSSKQLDRWISIFLKYELLLLFASEDGILSPRL